MEKSIKKAQQENKIFMVNTYLLDSSFIIEFFRKKPWALDFINSHENDVLVASVLSEAEIGEGIYRELEENISEKLKTKNEFFNSLSEVVVFDRRQADIAGRLRAELSKKGNRIGDIDVLIAAAAIARNAVLVTKNSRHFLKITGLQVEVI